MKLGRNGQCARRGQSLGQERAGKLPVITARSYGTIVAWDQTVNMIAAEARVSGTGHHVD
jgi:hypothetical protein